jgi:hypothetical protein
VAALIVGGVGLAVGLQWWVAAAVAVVSMFAGAAVSGWLFARGEPATSPPAPVAAIEGQSVFRLEGEFWTISYRGGAAIHLPRSKGLRYISRLLQTPGVEVHVLELAAIHQPAAAAPADGLHVQGSSRDPVLDAEALRQLRRRVDDLDDEIAEAERNNDPERLARARDEQERIVAEIRRDLRPDGRPREFTDEIERGRLNVTRAIKAAIEKIREQDPSLGHHLDHDIRKGTFCAYDPDTATTPVWVR